MNMKIKKILIGLLALVYTILVFLSPTLIKVVGSSAFNLYMMFTILIVFGSSILLVAAKTFDW